MKTMNIAFIMSETTPGKIYGINFDLDAAKVTCGCESFKYSKALPSTCKHLQKLQLALSVL